MQTCHHNHHCPSHTHYQALTRCSWVLVIPRSRGPSLGVQPWKLGEFGTGGNHCICWAENKKLIKVYLCYLKVLFPFPQGLPLFPQVLPLPLLLCWVAIYFLSLPPVSRYFSAAGRCLGSKSRVSEIVRNNAAAALKGFSVNRWLTVHKV